MSGIDRDRAWRTGGRAIELLREAGLVPSSAAGPRYRLASEFEAESAAGSRDVAAPIARSTTDTRRRRCRLEEIRRVRQSFAQHAPAAARQPKAAARWARALGLLLPAVTPTRVAKAIHDEARWRGEEGRSIGGRARAAALPPASVQHCLEADFDSVAATHDRHRVAVAGAVTRRSDRALSEALVRAGGRVPCST